MRIPGIKLPSAKILPIFFRDFLRAKNRGAKIIRRRTTFAVRTEVFMLVPDYYPKFRCKCGECRHCCCSGWGITVSFSEYCRLLGLDCSEKLRRKLDCAFFILRDADEERYAKLKPNYLGACPLQDENGLCALQCECGEEVLPSVCRTYPRNLLYPEYGEGACALSCEKVVEMLFEETGGVKFVSYGTADDRELELQKKSVEILQNRAVSLSERLINLGQFLSDDRREPAQSSPEEVFRTVTELVFLLESYSRSFSEYSIIAEEDLGIVNGVYDDEKVRSRYQTANEKFRLRYPLSEIYFENILINHIIFERFPYSATETPFEKYAELCGVYAVMRFVAVAYTENKPEKTALADCISGMFRCFEHSDADGAIKAALKRAGKLSLSYVYSIVKSV